MKEQYKKVVVGSTWRSIDRLVKVRGVEKHSGGVWVQYGSHGHDRTYECLIDAFLERFIETPGE